MIGIEVLKGQVITSITVDDDKKEILFVTETNRYKMYHEQDCCEYVYVESIVGDTNDLLNCPVLLAEERSNSERDTPEHESITYTFYEIATIKGRITIRWVGESNGYYSEDVYFREVSESGLEYE